MVEAEPVVGNDGIDPLFLHCFAQPGLFVADGPPYFGDLFQDFEAEKKAFFAIGDVVSWQREDGDLRELAGKEGGMLSFGCNKYHATSV